MEPLLNVREAAGLLGIKPATLYQYVWRRQVPFTKLEGALRFRPEALRAWVEERTVAPRPR